jgi:hypothetical protein
VGWPLALDVGITKTLCVPSSFSRRQEAGAGFLITPPGLDSTKMLDVD